MTNKFKVKGLLDNQTLIERAYTTQDELTQALSRAKVGQALWQARPLAERKGLVAAAVAWLAAQQTQLAQAITESIGRPQAQAGGEVVGMAERAGYMLNVAEAALADVVPEAKAGFTRRITRQPLGTVLLLAPWNYPLLTVINVLVPALVAGNVVLLKHASQTTRLGDYFTAAFAAVGLPEGVFQQIFLSHQDTEFLVQQPSIDFIAFTGSVATGRHLQRLTASRFVGMGLELGGKDPAYVRADANVADSALQLADGAFFNAGQSCCAVERIYVHQSCYEAFVAAFVAEAKRLVLGDPRLPETTLGPMVSVAAATLVRGQVQEACAAGAVALLDEADFPASQSGTAYLAPQVLVNVTHRMRVMTEESFGPVVGIMAVADDEAAIGLMNDSEYGLSASIWSADSAAVAALAPRLACGTVLMNRCDYLDPALAWTGVKDSGYGVSLSALGYGQLTRPQSHHFKTGLTQENNA